MSVALSMEVVNGYGIIGMMSQLTLQVHFVAMAQIRRKSMCPLSPKVALLCHRVIPNYVYIHAMNYTTSKENCVQYPPRSPYYAIV